MVLPNDTLIHLISGGIAGTAGAVFTCPLEVVKTRLQSSISVNISSTASLGHSTQLLRSPHCQDVARNSVHSLSPSRGVTNFLNSVSLFSATDQCRTAYRKPFLYRSTIFEHLRNILRHEGMGALFRGLGPNLAGVAPSRAVYFSCYQSSKNYWRQRYPDADKWVDAKIHTYSAVVSSFVCSTLTNPIWMIKTRLQLDRQRYGSHLRAWACVRSVYRDQGVFGFYRGVTASYLGVVETVTYFVIYEHLRSRVFEVGAENANRVGSTFTEFLKCMLAGGVAKALAACLAYPHEVARTRLREEGTRYTGLFQTLALVWREERVSGLYRGLGTQLVRQIPNSAIVMATYEGCAYLLTPAS